MAKRIRFMPARLLARCRLKGCSNTIELCVDLYLDLLCPTDLIHGAGHANLHTSGR